VSTVSVRGTRQVELAFGRGRLPLVLPDDCEATVIRQHPLPPLPDPVAAVASALTAPVGSPPLEVLARGRRSACILICDITRPVPNGLFLRPVIERIAGAGVPLDRITVLVATGLHRPNLGAELEELVGDPWVLEHVRVENHDARDDDAHRSLGRTATRGTPVALDRRFVDADLRIATGLVEPHFMAGWSGGRKVIAPGVAHHTTIRTFHSARFMEDPGAVQCRLEGNPLHEEQLEIVRMLGEVYGLNTVVDEERRLVHVTFGEVVASHQASVDHVAEAIQVPVGRRFSTVVTSAAGYPLDKTYYQTVKGMVTPLDVLEPGGTLIIASECSEGFGSREFREAQQRLSELGPDAFLATITGKDLADVDEWQTEMQLKPVRRGRVELYSPGLSAADRALTVVHPVDDLTAAVHASMVRSGDPAVAVIPDGPYVVPVVGGGSRA
jgi:lactate racemase